MGCVSYILGISGISMMCIECIIRQDNLNVINKMFFDRAYFGIEI